MPIGEYVTPDGKLKFLVTCPDDEWSLGFDGFPSHTHGSILASLSGQAARPAVQQFIADLTGSTSIIALKRISGVLTDVWVSDDPAGDRFSCERYGSAGETIEFRRWDGSIVNV